jgi:hypothetical protein
MTTSNVKQSEMVLRLTPDLAKEVRFVAEELRMTQAAFIRKTLARGVAFSRKNELPLLQNPKIKDALSIEAKV